MLSFLLAQAEPAAAPSPDSPPPPAALGSEQLWALGQQYGVPALTVLLIILGALLVSSWIGSAIRSACERAKLDTTLARFFGKLARWGVLLIAGLFCLDQFGIQTASFAVVLGSAGLALGLAFQGTLGNFAAGVMLLIFRPFKVNDVVQVAGQIGKVNEIDLFTTVLDTGDNRRIIVPNGAVFGSTIENITHHHQRRVDVAVGVTYSADIEATRKVLSEAAATVPGSLKDPAPQILLMDLGSSSVNWQVRVWAPTADYWVVRDATTATVKRALDAAGISIPFPQMDVHLDGSLLKS